ncbi:hypothetical protein IFM89_025062 [Coptis chinensis]|uniref:Uncharacterized protein n=1 Tax=Coptis chinensis TaxID=261450 RepID=A0A835I550_9MAGN|nr:hypothetical protein IFM89_025062 [Coptis chinensis]
MDTRRISNNINSERRKRLASRIFSSEDGVANGRGRVLGGSCAINAGFYSRADDDFFKQPGFKLNLDLVNRSYDWIEKAVVLRPQLKTGNPLMMDFLKLMLHLIMVLIFIMLLGLRLDGRRVLMIERDLSERIALLGNCYSRRIPEIDRAWPSRWLLMHLVVCLAQISFRVSKACPKSYFRLVNVYLTALYLLVVQEICSPLSARRHFEHIKKRCLAVLKVLQVVSSELDDETSGFISAQSSIEAMPTVRISQRHLETDSHLPALCRLELPPRGSTSAFSNRSSSRSDRTSGASSNTGARVSVAFPDSLLLGEWEDRVQRGLFRYDVTACETKV